VAASNETAHGATAHAVVDALALLADPERAEGSAGFFKTGPGGYAEGDVFIGVSVPQQRRVARTFRDLRPAEIAALLASPIHEHRFTALLVLVDQFRRGDEPAREAVAELYLTNVDRINNWDLVDVSAADIVGDHTRPDGIAPLLPLAASSNLWERRIAMVACLADTRAGESDRPLAVAELLAHDEHDLIHKAVGWVLREVGKRCGRDVLVAWLVEGGRYRSLPRTTLRYAIEHFDPEERACWRAGTYESASK
jgi:3-methyladenine DNA glycosylase AlkD